MATYATFDSGFKDTHLTLSNGNLTVTKDSGTANSNTRTTMAKVAGKWYWELHLDSATDGQFGIGSGLLTATGNPLDNNKYALVWFISSAIWYNAGNITAGQTATTGDTIGFALDLDSSPKTIGIYKNNVAVTNSPFSFTTYPITGAPAYYFVADLNAASSYVTANFGATALTYTPPSGYNAGLYVNNYTRTQSDSIAVGASRLATVARLGTYARATSDSIMNAASRLTTLARNWTATLSDSMMNAASRFVTLKSRLWSFIQKSTASWTTTPMNSATIHSTGNKSSSTWQDQTKS